MKIKILFLNVFLFLCACSLAPTYHRPDEKIIPCRYKEMGTWLKATPHSSHFARGQWWRMYHDEELNALEEKLTCNNQNLKAAIARFDQAKAAFDVARSNFFPTINAVGNLVRQSPSQTTGTLVPINGTYNDEMIGANLSYEIDAWARVRNSVIAAKTLAKASADDVAVVSLTLHAELANDYFALRNADIQQALLNKKVTVYEKALYLMQQRYQGGASSVIDVEDTKNQLQAAKTKAEDIHIQRSQLEHAIAILIGEPPAQFTIKPKPYAARIVTIALDLPSTLLERRPDIAEAEFQVEAANATIGVARAAFFPALNFWSSIGYESQSLSNLIQAPSLVWSLGPSGTGTLLNSGAIPLVTQLLFDGGMAQGLTDQAKAHYRETVAHYRQTVLTAFQEVEDNLIAIKQLDRENRSQTAATTAANHAYQQAIYRFNGGITTYLDVVQPQITSLQMQLDLHQIQTRREITSVQLIRALGGGFHSEMKN